MSASQVLDSSITSPLVTMHSPMETNGNGVLSSNGSVPRSLSLGNTTNLSAVQGQDSPVMNETLSVIQEHISDMQPPRSISSGFGDRRGTNDSGSDYSVPMDHRMSYINGEETDEEESNMHSESEVSSWNASQVSEYLLDVGVEQKHCDVFREQEITGDVLLGMDQTSVFLKEFDLGSVGRRLKTWQKIKGLQDEVKGIATAASGSRRNTSNYSNDSSSVDNSGRSRSNTSGSVLPRMPSMMDKSGQQNSRYSSQPVRSDTMTSTMPSSPKPPGLGDKPRRPSAASIRDLHHSRRSSANEFSTATFRGTQPLTGPEPSAIASKDVSHKKQPSFDRNWTMGSQSPAASPRPLSASGSKTLNPPSPVKEKTPDINITTPIEFERGYFSGGEADGRTRNVLRKKDSTSHSRNSSYTDEQRFRSATATVRHSRFGSVDSIQQQTVSPASQKYYGLSMGRRRTPSADTISRPAPPPKDNPVSPTVTNLDASSKSAAASPRSASYNKIPGSITPGITSSPPFFLASLFDPRMKSDSVPAAEKSGLTSPAVDNFTSPVPDSLKSPSRTGSSTTSGGPSFELDSNPSKSPSTMTTPGSKGSRRKAKKETSAYTRGLEKKTPQEQMLNCDFSGWMKKKSTNIMTTWKPRLFVLKGRRLSYYYSEDDTEEKGLIDISFHRVLPADNERLTGLHATLTGAATSPTTPETSHTPTIAATEVANEPQSSLTKAGADQMFIFKLVPPRAGLSRAVNFTKPTVHYFAVPNLATGRLWMAALMKATIDRDDTKSVTTTYQQKTISLAKARAMRHRPPALMNLDEKVEEEPQQTPAVDTTGLNIRGIIFDHESHEGDSGVSGVSRNETPTANGTSLEPDLQPQAVTQ